MNGIILAIAVPVGAGLVWTNVPTNKWGHWIAHISVLVFAFAVLWWPGIAAHYISWGFDNPMIYGNAEAIALGLGLVSLVLTLAWKHIGPELGKAAKVGVRWILILALIGAVGAFLLWASATPERIDQWSLPLGLLVVGFIGFSLFRESKKTKEAEKKKKEEEAKKKKAGGGGGGDHGHGH